MAKDGAKPATAGERGPTVSELRTIPLFHGFGDEELREIGDLFTRVETDPKTPLFDLHEPATTLYLLTAGEVTLDRPGDDHAATSFDA